MNTKANQDEAISTNEEMAKFIVENPSHRYSNQQFVIYVLHGEGGKVDRAKLFEMVNRVRAGIDGIAFDSIVEGLVEEEIIHLAGSVILSDWFVAYLEKYMNQKANSIDLEQIAKNIVYQLEENLSDLELLAKLFFISRPINEAEIIERLLARRQIDQEKIPDLLKKLQELGIIGVGGSEPFATGQFVNRVSFHKREFHEGIKGPTASQVDEGSSADNTKHMREGLEKCRLLEKLMPMVAARNKGIHFVDPKWTTQEYVNALVFGVLGDSYLDKVCIFNNVSLLMKENRPSHDVLVEWVANALTYFVSCNIAEFNSAKDYRLTDDAIKCIKEAEERLKPKVAPFEVSYKVYGKTLTFEEMIALPDFLITFLNVAKGEGDFGNIFGIRIDREKAEEILYGFESNRSLFDEVLMKAADRFPSINSVFGGTSPTYPTHYRNGIRKHTVAGYTHQQLAADVGDVRAPNYDPVRYRKDADSKPETDIPNGH